MTYYIPAKMLEGKSKKFSIKPMKGKMRALTLKDIDELHKHFTDREIVMLSREA